MVEFEFRQQEIKSSEQTDDEEEDEGVAEREQKSGYDVAPIGVCGHGSASAH